MDGDSITFDPPRPWSDRRIEAARGFALHPDGNRIAAAVVRDTPPDTRPRDHVTFIFNFFDDLRRIAH
jgi:hypothetical protein